MATIKSDICVIGASLEGLSIAQTLSQRGLDVLIIEKSDRVGGSLYPTKTDFGSLSKQFSYWPDSPATDMALKFVSGALGREISPTKETLPPQTFNKGQLQTFVGFGENAPDFVDELSFYLSDARAVTPETASSLLEELQTKFAGKIIFGSGIKSIQHTDDSVQSLELEDGRVVEASRFIFCQDPRHLFDLLPTEEYSQREIQRVNRAPLWNTVTLDVIHSTPTTDQKNVFILLGTTKESLPCLGGFDTPYESGTKTLQNSHWITFVSIEHEDEELSANALREMKRQIKRVFPHAFENVAFEKITLHPHSHGKLPLKADAQSRWPGLSNFWVASSHLNSQPNIIGSLCQAALVVESVCSTSPQEILANPVAESHL